MARLASQEKLGYYKTPVKIVNQIKTCIQLYSGVRVLDPCCGEGEAVSLLNKEGQAETLGIELEKGRFEKASHCIDQVLWADALTEATVSFQSVDLLFLNPPYDLDEGSYDQIRERFEYQFLKKFYRCLSKNGFLVFIIPIGSLKLKGVQDILSGFSELEIFRFPDDEFETFKQIVVIGRRKAVSKNMVNDNFEKMESIFFRPINEIPTTDHMVEKHEKDPIVIDSNSRENFTFKALHIDPLELVPLTSDLNKTFFKSVSPEGLNDVRPLIPLRQGHLAMLLAAGYVNGEIKQDGKHLIIKGTVKRQPEVSEEVTETHRITKTREKVRIMVRVLDMETGCIDDIE